MSLNRYARRKDANKDELVDAYRKAGWFIYESEKPLDLLGFKYFWFVIEVKIRTGRYTKAQEKFLREAPANAPILTARSLDDVMRHTKLATDMYLSGKVDWKAFKRDSVKA